MDDNVKQLLSGAGGTLLHEPAPLTLCTLPQRPSISSPAYRLRRARLALRVGQQRAKLQGRARSALFSSTPRIEELLGLARGSSVCMIRLSGSLTGYLSARLQP